METVCFKSQEEMEAEEVLGHTIQVTPLGTIRETLLGGLQTVETEEAQFRRLGLEKMQKDPAEAAVVEAV